MAKTGGKCHYCGEHADTLDHIVPRSVGGPSRQWNLIGACKPCNLLKRDCRGVCICFDCIAAERMFAGFTQPALNPPSKKTLARRRREQEYASSLRCPIAGNGQHVRAYSGMGDFCVKCSEVLPLSA